MGRKKTEGEVQHLDPGDTETKADKFVRLANRRVAAVLKRLYHVETLFSRQSYEWTDEQRAKILSALAKAMRRIDDKSQGARVDHDGFTL